ncbi:MAG: serine/threonine protein kinase, partial [Acidobacteria bacterium]|nr:serine/threonine protein kinase [Acidobacteriota bacterium]
MTAGFPQIPGYKIVSALGEGGMASVYLAIQEKLGRNVAVKVLEPSLSKNDIAAARFDREARTAAGLSHSNIIQIFDYGKSGIYHYIIMEYLQDSLKEFIKRSPLRKVDPVESLDLVKKIMDALDYAHFRGIYHRDIKPDNIMFREDTTPVLVDFGIAGLYDSTKDLTKTGKSLGTIYYMSPEQCKAQPVDGRSDIYSLGVVLFEMLTGQKPYDGETPFSIAFQHLNESIPSLPQALNRYQPIIDKMMAKEKEKRISSSPEFLAILDKILTITPPPISQSPGIIPQPLIEKTSIKTGELQPLPKTNKREFTFKEITPMNPVKDKLGPFMDDLVSIRHWFKNKTTALIYFLVKNKRLLTIGSLILILLFAVYIFINQPKKQPSYITKLIDYGVYYYEKNLNLARELSGKEDLESLKKGRDLANALIKINPNQENKTLAEDFTKKVNKLE